MKRTELDFKLDSWCLLSYLQTQERNRWIGKKEICENIKSFKLNEDKNIHDECNYIWTCKNYINNHYEEFKFLIISNSKGEIKIPTEKELVDYLEKEKKRLCVQWKRFWNKAKATGLIGQLTLDNEIMEIVKEK